VAGCPGVDRHSWAEAGLSRDGAKARRRRPGSMVEAWPFVDPVMASEALVSWALIPVTGRSPTPYV
jgi:hypothetical protein